MLIKVLPSNKNLTLRDIHTEYTVCPFSTNPTMAPFFHPPPCQLLFQASLPSSVAECHNKASISFGWRIQMKMNPRLCVFLPSFPVCRFLYSSWVCDFQEEHITVLGCLPVAHFCHPRYRNWTSPTAGRNVSRNCVERIVSLVSRLKTEDWQDLASLLFHCISITQELGEFTSQLGLVEFF